MRGRTVGALKSTDGRCSSIVFYPIVIYKYLILIKRRQNYETRLSTGNTVVLQLKESHHRVQHEITVLFIQKTTEKTTGSFAKYLVAYRFGRKKCIMVKMIDN